MSLGTPFAVLGILLRAKDLRGHTKENQEVIRREKTFINSFDLEDVEKRARAKSEVQNGAIGPIKEALVNNEDFKPKYTSSPIEKRKTERPSYRCTLAPDYKKRKTRERRTEIFIEVKIFVTSMVRIWQK